MTSLQFSPLRVGRATRSNTGSSLAWDPTTGSPTAFDTNNPMVGRIHSYDGSSNTAVLYRGVVAFDTSAIGGTNNVSSATIGLSVSGLEEFVAYYASGPDWNVSSGIPAFGSGGGNIQNVQYINKTGNTYFLLVSTLEATDPGVNQSSLSTVFGATLNVEATAPAGGGGGSGNPPSAPALTYPAAGQTVPLIHNLTGTYYHPDGVPGKIRFFISSGGTYDTGLLNHGQSGSVSVTTPAGANSYSAYAYDQYGRVGGSTVEVAYIASSSPPPITYPDAPTLNTPTNGSTISSANVRFEAVYNHSGGVAGYVQFKVTKSGVTTIYKGQQVSAGASSFVVVPLLTSGAYTYVAQGVDANGLGSDDTSSRSFTTTGNPAAPVPIVPTSGTIIAPTTLFQATYNHPDGINGYVKWVLTGASSTTVTGSIVSPGQISQATATLPVGSYNVTVTAVDVQGTPLNSTALTFSFTVANVPVMSSPNPAGTTLSPAFVTASNPILQATYNHGAGLSANAYQVRVWLPGKNDSNGVPVYDTGIKTTTLTPSSTVSQQVTSGALNYGTTYEWEIRARDTNGNWGPYMTRQVFTTNIAPNPPTLGTLSDGSIIYAFPQSFQINFSDPNVGNKMSKYQWQLLANSVISVGGPTPGTTVVKDSGEVTVANLTTATASITNTDDALTWGNLYWLRVRTWDDYGAPSQWSQPIKVYTNSVPTATPTYPVSNQTVQTTTPTLYFTLNDLTDPNATPTYRYWIEIYQLDGSGNRVGQVYTTNGWIVVSAGNFSHVVNPSVPGRGAGLIAGTPYEWQIKMDDGYLQSASWSTPAKFTTEAGPGVAITSPSAGAITTSRLPVTWTFTPNLARPQTTYRVLAKRQDTGATLFDSGAISDPAHTTRDYTIPAGYIPYINTQNVIAVFVECGDGTSTTRSAPTLLTPTFPTVPAVTLISVEGNDTKNRVEVAFEAVNISVTEFSEYRIIRRTRSAVTNGADPAYPRVEKRDTATWYIVGKVLERGTPGDTLTFHDYLVGSGVLYDYSVLAVSRVDGWSDLATSTSYTYDHAGIAHKNYSMLCSANDPTNYRLKGEANPKHQIQRSLEFRDFYPMGRDYPLRVYGTQNNTRWSFSFQYQEQDETAVGAMLEVLAGRREKLFLADSRGNEFFCALDQDSRDYVAPKGLYGVSVSLTGQASPFKAQAVSGFSGSEL